MNSFWQYYSGEKEAPFPTIFIGGNHEAFNYHLWELYYGGWAAPNIYFLGLAGVVKFGNVRIGWLSGIYKPRDYSLAGHFERPPYNESDIKSVYHVREYDVHKLMQVQEPVDIFISHDWPLGITDHGDWRDLVRDKPHFENEKHHRNPQTEAFLQFLQLQYLLDNTMQQSELTQSPSSFISKGSIEYDSEEIPIDDVDDTEQLPEDNDVGTKEDYS